MSSVHCMYSFICVFSTLWVSTLCTQHNIVLFAYINSCNTCIITSTLPHKSYLAKSSFTQDLQHFKIIHGLCRRYTFKLLQVDRKSTNLYALLGYGSTFCFRSSLRVSRFYISLAKLLRHLTNGIYPFRSEDSKLYCIH